MPCIHLKKLYQLCEQTGLKLSSSDLIRISCRECGEVEVCPSVLLDEFEIIHEHRKAEGGLLGTSIPNDEASD